MKKTSSIKAEIEATEGLIALDKSIEHLKDALRFVDGWEEEDLREIIAILLKISKKLEKTVAAIRQDDDLNRL